MSLHSILALDRVVHEYREYLRTEFRAKDPALRASLEEALDRPLFLAQPLPAVEFGGFLALRNESPVLDEEE